MDHEKIFSISIQTNGVNISFRLEKIECRCLFLSFCIVYTVCMRARAYIFLLSFFGYGLFVQPFPISKIYNVQGMLCEILRFRKWVNCSLCIKLPSQLGYWCGIWREKEAIVHIFARESFHFFLLLVIPFHMNTLFTNTEKKQLHSSSWYIRCMQFYKVELNIIDIRAYIVVLYLSVRMDILYMQELSFWYATTSFM